MNYRSSIFDGIVDRRVESLTDDNARQHDMAAVGRSRRLQPNRVSWHRFRLFLVSIKTIPAPDSASTSCS